MNKISTDRKSAKFFLGRLGDYNSILLYTIKLLIDYCFLASDTSKGVWFNTTESASHTETTETVVLHHGISPRPFKKLSNTFKNVNVPRRTFNNNKQDGSNASSTTTLQSDTPPESPTLPPRRGRN